MNFSFVQDLQTMGNLPFSVFAFLVTSLLLYSFYLIWRNFHRARVIEDTPTAKVRSAHQGYVELEGGVRFMNEEPLVAPLTRLPCVWFRYKIEKERRSGRSRTTWSKVDSGVSDAPFLFHDDTGECLVDPRKAEVTPGVKKVWYGRTKWPGVEEPGGLLGALAGRRYRYTEERIDEGHAYILGWFDTLRSTDTPVSEEVSQTLRDWKQDQDELNRRFDTNRDGRLDEGEWQKARQEAHRQVVQGRAQRSAEADVHIVRATDHDRHPFLISAKPQTLLTGRYRRNAALSLAGSVFAAGFLAWMLVVRF
jgi:hypothetical protein